MKEGQAEHNVKIKPHYNPFGHTKINLLKSRYIQPSVLTVTFSELPFYLLSFI